MSAKILGLFLGPLLCIVVLVLPTFAPFEASAQALLGTAGSSLAGNNLASSMQIVLAVLLLMIVWWITEAIPLPITALMPAIILPLCKVTGFSGGAMHEFTLKNVLAHYANPVIYLFIGGFLLAASMQKWGLDRRLTLWILTRGRLADRTGSILLAMMAVTAFISMWISNTATTAMMLPLGLGMLRSMNLQPGSSRFGMALMLGIAWAASIGGVGTIIGTPPNGIALGILNSTFANDPAYVRITFLDWMAFGIPYVAIMIPVAWGILLWKNPPEIRSIAGGKEQLTQERNSLGPWNFGEKATVGVFLTAVVLWVTNPFWNSLLPEVIARQISWVDEYSIGLFIGLLPFFIPVNLREGKFLLEWKDSRFIDWGTLILFGGGIALSDAMFKTGLAGWIAQSFVGFWGTPSTLVLMIAIVFMVDFLTEVTSNTAVTGMLVPIVISIAVHAGENPVSLSVATAVAASMAFMLPVGTPPNALVYGTGFIKLKDMVRNGFILDIAGWIATVFILYLIGGQLFGVLKF